MFYQTQKKKLKIIEFNVDLWLNYIFISTFGKIVSNLGCCAAQCRLLYMNWWYGYTIYSSDKSDIFVEKYMNAS